MELVTGYDTVAPFAAETLEDVLTRSRLHEAGVAMRRATTLAGIEPGRVDAENEFGEPFTIAADAVVLVTQRVSATGSTTGWRARCRGCTGSETASRRGSWPRSCSTATGWRGKSTSRSGVALPYLRRAADPGSAAGPGQPPPELLRCPAPAPPRPRGWSC